MNVISFLFPSRRKAPRADIEHRPSTASFAFPPAAADAARVSRDIPRAPPEPNDAAVTAFRLLIGISSNAQIHPPGSTWFSASKRPAPNIGIFPRIIHNEQRAKEGYKTFSWVINVCFGLQIVVAAALTAMGAGNVNHAAITVFGAINTVIAGLLTFLKGSGLPNRVKYYRNEWKKLREYIEQREREFIINPDAVSMEDVQQAVLAIGQMYEDIQADVDANTPDAFVSASNARLKVQAAGLPRGLAVGQLKTPNVTLPEVNTRDVNEKIQGANEQIHVVNRAVHDFSEKVEGANERIHDVQEKAHHGFGARLGELKEMAVQFGSQRDKLKNELGSVEGSRSKAENFVSDISRKAKEIAEEMVKHEKEAVNDVSNQIHNRAHDAVEHARSTADGMHHDVHGALGSAQRHTRDAVSHAGGTVSNAQHDAVEFADRQRQAGHIAFDTAQERVQTIAENAHQGVQDAADRERRQVRDAEESAHDTVHKALQ